MEPSGSEVAKMRGTLQSLFGAVWAFRAATEVEVREAFDPPVEAEDEGVC